MNSKNFNSDVLYITLTLEKQVHYIEKVTIKIKF